MNMDIHLLCVLTFDFYFTCFHLFLFLSAIFYSFQHVSLDTSLVQHIPKYLIPSDATINRITFKFPLQVVHHWYTEPQMVPVFWSSTETLNSFISSSSFIVDDVIFSMYRNMPSMNRDYFTSSFAIQMPFISFYCIVLARTFSTNA